MRVLLKSIMGLVILFGMSLYVTPVCAQNSLMTKGQSGFGFWGGKFSTKATGFGAVGGGFGVSDFVEIGFQAPIGSGVDDDPIFTLAFHIPTPKEKTTVGLAAVVIGPESMGVGVESYMRVEVTRGFLFVPLVSAIHYPEIETRFYWGGSITEAATAVTVGAHMAFEVADGTMLVLTPQYGFWSDERPGDSYGVTLGILFYG